MTTYIYIYTHISAFHTTTSSLTAIFRGVGVFNSKLKAVLARFGPKLKLDQATLTPRSSLGWPISKGY